MSPFSPYSKQSTHILQQEMDRKAGRGRGEGGKGGEGKKEGEKERKKKGRQRERKEEMVKNYLMIR